MTTTDFRVGDRPLQAVSRFAGNQLAIARAARWTTAANPSTLPRMIPNWKSARTYTDILYHKGEGIAKITINRPAKRNAFRPETIAQMYDAFSDAREDPEVGVVLLTGAGPHTDGKYAFCAGGDQSVRGHAGYIGDDGVPRLNVLDLQKLIRSIPKVGIALVAGYAIGGGHVLHLVCDLTIAADNGIFGQAGPNIGSFDGGFGSSS